MVCFHVDNLKVSQKEEDAVTVLALKLGQLCGPKTAICCEKIHEYLGMDIDWLTKPGVRIVYMVSYLQKIIDKFPEVIKSTSPSSAGDYLFNVRE